MQISSEYYPASPVNAKRKVMKRSGTVLRPGRQQLAVGLLVGLFALPAAAWEVIRDWRDPIGQRTHVAAGTTNSDGFSIYVFRDNDKKVYAVYSISRSSFEKLPIEGRVLMLRPGDNKVSEIKAEILGDDAKSDGKAVRDVLWHGEEPSPTFGTLRDILDSNVLYARFYTDTGKELDTEWSLLGARDAISAAIGIVAEVDPRVQARAKAAADILGGGVLRCGIDFHCTDMVLRCSREFERHDDVERFRQCVERASP